MTLWITWKYGKCEPNIILWEIIALCVIFADNYLYYKESCWLITF